MVTDLHHFIDGRNCAGRCGAFADLHDPATGKLSARVPLAGTQEVDTAVAAAARAWPAWAATPPLRRARVMFRFKALLEEHLRRTRRLITAEHGKLFSDAKGEVVRGIEIVEFACGIPHLLKGDFTDQVGAGLDSYSAPTAWRVRRHHAVQFSRDGAVWMFLMATACGNTFVLKPSETDAVRIASLAELFIEAGAAQRRVQCRAMAARMPSMH